MLDPVLLPNGRSAAASIELIYINKGNSLRDLADELLIMSSDPVDTCTKLDCDICERGELFINFKNAKEEVEKRNNYLA